MPMTPETRSTVDVVVVLVAVFVILWSTVLGSHWLRYRDRGECLVQHRATVMEWHFNGVTYEDRPVSRMVCDSWEYPEGR